MRFCLFENGIQWYDDNCVDVKHLTTQELKQPKLTFPADVAALVAATYEEAHSILEYGSGGSTVLAAKMPNKEIYSVESDKAWAEDMRHYLSHSPDIQSKALIHHVNIGKTKKWGAPVDDRSWRQWHKYPLSVWSAHEFRQPQVVLIDGRFRAACFFAVCMKTAKPVRILFDDYTERQHYHVVEVVSRPKHTTGRMAIFEIVPNMINRSMLDMIFESFCSPQ